MRTAFVLLAGVLFVQGGCRAEPTFAVDTVSMGSEVLQIPYREIALPLPKPPPLENFFFNKDPREFAYSYALKGYAPLFQPHLYKSPNEDYTYNADNSYVSTFTRRNQITRPDPSPLLTVEASYVIDDTFTAPIAYRAECPISASLVLLSKGTTIQPISLLDFRQFLEHPIESPGVATVLFTEDHIYIKAYHDPCFRRYSRKPADTSGQWYSEQKAREMHKTYLQSLREMSESADSTASNEEALALAEWRLTHGAYDEACVKDILLLAEGECYDFLQLKWWRSESSEERLCILMCFYHRLNPEVSHFPSFHMYSQRFEEKERDSRLKEIEFVKALRESRRLE